MWVRPLWKIHIFQAYFYKEDKEDKDLNKEEAREVIEMDKGLGMGISFGFEVKWIGHLELIEERECKVPSLDYVISCYLIMISW